jgi:hypothetical protein
MRKSLFAICLSLVVAIVLLAVFVPSCTPTTKGTINVVAKLCGDPWPTQGTGAVNYTLTPVEGSPINGDRVPKSFSVDAGSWSCAYVSGFPPGAYFVDITPSSPQTLAAGGNITFTLNFELNQDAAIEFITWSVDGEPWLGPTLEVHPCQIIDVHFKQWVAGCENYTVAVNETSKLWIHYDGYSDHPGGNPLPPPAVVWLNVVNDRCAVNKTAPQMPPPEKGPQVTSLKGVPIMPPHELIPLNFCDNTTYLDVETAWQLVKETDYVKTINWLGISLQPDMHECVLFDLLFGPPVPGWYHFTLVAEAEVKLVDDEDVNLDNNHAMSPPLSLWVWVPGP